jgi:hypothetical protein
MALSRRMGGVLKIHMTVRRRRALSITGCAAGVAAAAMSTGGCAGGPTPSAAVAYVTPAPIAGLDAQRLATTFGDKYGLRFAEPGGVAPAAAPGSAVSEFDTSLGRGAHAKVVLFGDPDTGVRALSCEITGTDPTGAAAFLADCAKNGTSAAQAGTAGSWTAAAITGAPAPGLADAVPAGSRATEFGPVQYVLRAVPTRREWILSMTGQAR